MLRTIMKWHPFRLETNKKAMIFLLLLCASSIPLGIGRGIKGHPDYEWLRKTSEEQCGQLVNGHLPTNVEPKHYKMTIKFDHSNSSFSGYVIISVKILNETRKITINGKGLKIGEVSFVENDRYYVPDLRYCKREETITLTFEKNLTIGTGDLHLFYKGQLNHNFFGCKRCKNAESLTQISKFAFISARRAFPCFDEPCHRTTFQVKLIAMRNSAILPNTPEAKDIPYGNSELNMHKVVFSSTPKISTVLLAFVIGDYDFIETKSKDGHVLIRVYTPKGKVNEGKFALKAAVDILEFFQKYFEIIFPLPKLDIIANSNLPVKSAENWGLIIFHESTLLIDRNSNSINLEMDIARNVAYEIARQWIDNSVTLGSWTEIWLQEGLSTLLAYISNDALHPEWNVWNSFLVNEFAVALRVDSSNSSYPLELNSTDFKNTFEEIIFKKGASILRMLCDWIGEKNFQEGVKLFLRKHKYDNVNTTDFFMIMNDVSKLPVNEVMQTWVTQRGHPLIEVETCDNCTSFNITQEKFLIGNIKEFDEPNALWKIPMLYTTNLDLEKEEKLILMNKSVTIDRNSSTGVGVLVKSECTGFYRVKYPKNVSNHLFEFVRLKKLKPQKRFCLQNDFFAMAKAGKESIVDYLRHLENYRDEDELFIWDSIQNTLTEISSLLSNTDCHENFCHYIRSVMKNVFNKTGWDGNLDEETSTTILRSLALTTMGLAGDPFIVKEAISRFIEHVNHRREINSNLTSTVFGIVAVHGNETMFDDLFSLYNSSQDIHEKHKISLAMGRTTNETLIGRLLSLSLSKNLTFDATANIIVSVTSSLKGRKLAWKFFKKNENEIRKRSKSKEHANVGYLIRGILSSHASFDKADEFEEYFKSHPFPELEAEIQESLDVVRENAEWLRRDGNYLCQFLKQQNF